jgi:hypothetical protein
MERERLGSFSRLRGRRAAGAAPPRGAAAVASGRAASFECALCSLTSERIEDYLHHVRQRASALRTQLDAPDRGDVSKAMHELHCTSQRASALGALQRLLLIAPLETVRGVLAEAELDPVTDRNVGAAVLQLSRPMQLLALRRQSAVAIV